MFLFRASRYLEGFQILRPGKYLYCIDPVANARARPDYIRMHAEMLTWKTLQTLLLRC